MGNRLYVGNIPFAATNESLKEFFAQAGSVTDVQVMVDKLTGRSRGFAFVTMASDADARSAIEMFNGKPCEGRPITVNEARPREEHPTGGGREPRSFGGGGGRGGHGGGRGGGRRDSGGGGERRGGYNRE